MNVSHIESHAPRRVKRSATRTKVVCDATPLTLAVPTLLLCIPEIANSYSLLLSPNLPTASAYFGVASYRHPDRIKGFPLIRLCLPSLLVGAQVHVAANSWTWGETGRAPAFNPPLHLSFSPRTDNLVSLYIGSSQTICIDALHPLGTISEAQPTCQPQRRSA